MSTLVGNVPTLELGHCIIGGVDAARSLPSYCYGRQARGKSRSSVTTAARKGGILDPGACVLLSKNFASEVGQGWYLADEFVPCTRPELQPVAQDLSRPGAVKCGAKQLAVATFHITEAVRVQGCV